MSFSCGLVGLPNVGKSTLFSALTQIEALSANYPFTTIEPNKARVPVPDVRLSTLASIAKSKEIIPSFLEIVDIAGLVKGASQGEGLGNQFLANIREVDLIIQVVRFFHDKNVTHVFSEVDPIFDFEVISQELIEKDKQTIQDYLNKKKTRANASASLAELEEALQILSQFEFLYSHREKLLESEHIRALQLLTIKPMMVVANLDERAFQEGFSETYLQFQRTLESKQIPLIPICAKLEKDLLGLSLEEKELFLQEIPSYPKEGGFFHMLLEGSKLLEIQQFFTVGEKEAHSWTIPKNSTAWFAAGKIHTDIQKGFINAEIIHYQDFVDHQGEAGCKASGKMSLQGKNYILEDGDIIHIRFNRSISSGK